MLHYSSHGTRRTRFAGIVVAGLVLSIALTGTALAGKPSGNGSTSGSSLTGPVVLVDRNGDGVASHRDDITFNVSTSVAKPNVGVRCYQSSMWVYDAYVGYFSGYMFDPWFTLDSSYWADGATSNCTARLFYNDRRGRQVVLATLSFDVTP